jgi:hypothetical protein
VRRVEGDVVVLLGEFVDDDRIQAALAATGSEVDLKVFVFRTHRSKL